MQAGNTCWPPFGRSSALLKVMRQCDKCCEIASVAIEGMHGQGNKGWLTYLPNVSSQPDSQMVQVAHRSRVVLVLLDPLVASEKGKLCKLMVKGEERFGQRSRGKKMSLFFFFAWTSTLVPCSFAAHPQVGFRSTVNQTKGKRLLAQDQLTLL